MASSELLTEPRNAWTCSWRLGEAPLPGGLSKLRDTYAWLAKATAEIPGDTVNDGPALRAIKHQHVPLSDITYPWATFWGKPHGGRPKTMERVLKIARSGDRAYSGARIAVFPVGRAPSRGAFVDF